MEIKKQRPMFAVKTKEGTAASDRRGKRGRLALAQKTKEKPGLF